jgi:hypothetical protein
MTMIAFIVVLLALVAFVILAGRFGADSRPSDACCAKTDWPFT